MKDQDPEWFVGRKKVWFYWQFWKGRNLSWQKGTAASDSGIRDGELRETSHQEIGSKLKFSKPSSFRKASLTSQTALTNWAPSVQMPEPTGHIPHSNHHILPANQLREFRGCAQSYTKDIQMMSLELRLSSFSPKSFIHFSNFKLS